MTDDDQAKLGLASLEAKNIYFSSVDEVDGGALDGSSSRQERQKNFLDDAARRQGNFSGARALTRSPTRSVGDRVRARRGRSLGRRPRRRRVTERASSRARSTRSPTRSATESEAELASSLGRRPGRRPRGLGADSGPSGRARNPGPRIPGPESGGPISLFSGKPPGRPGADLGGPEPGPGPGS